MELYSKTLRHHSSYIYAEYIVFPMATQSIRLERGLIYQKYISSRNTLLLLFVILKLAILCLRPQNSTLPDFRVKSILFCWIFRVLCYKQGSHITKQVFHILVMEMNMKMLCIRIVSDFPRPLVPIRDCLVLFSLPED